MFLYCNKFEETMLWKNPRVRLETLFDMSKGKAHDDGIAAYMFIFN